MSSDIDVFKAGSDNEIKAWIEANHYLMPRKLDDGSWVAISRLMYTWAVCVDMDEVTAYRYRWCFGDITEALHFLSTIKEFDEVPVRRKSLKGHRYSGDPLLVEYCERGYPRW